MARMAVAAGLFVVAASLIAVAAGGSAWADAPPSGRLALGMGNAAHTGMATRSEAAGAAVAEGWASFLKGDLTEAEAHFQAARRLAPRNGEAYHGLAVVAAERGAPVADIDHYFRLAVASPIAGPAARVDYARFLNLQGRFTASLTQAEQALDIASTARDARAQISYTYASLRDAALACDWAQAARDNGDDLEPGFLDSVCRHVTQ